MIKLDVIKMDTWMCNVSSPTIKRVWKRLRAKLVESTKTVRPTAKAMQCKMPPRCDDCPCNDTSCVCLTYGGDKCQLTLWRHFSTIDQLK